jgi:3-oxoadipate enol-lactonase/4-carboxymuconolactone decarboxylase
VSRVLVLAGSLGTTRAMWDPQVPVLAQWLDVIVVEHRGHGAAAPARGPLSIDDLGRDLLAALDRSHVPRASVCGLSLGGMAGMWLAAHHPERVDRLVLVSTGAHVPPAAAWQERAATVRRDGVVSLLDMLMERWFTDHLAGRTDVRERFAAMLASVDGESYARCCEAIAAMDLRPVLDRITAPTLVIAGREDPVTTPAMAVDLQHAIADARLVVLPGARHLASYEQAAAFSAAVMDHVVGTSDDRGRAMRRRVLGDAHVERSDARRTERNAPFLDYITRTAWGEVWSRPGLDLRTRSALTIAVLAALGRTEELALHLRAASRAGLSDAEVTEILLHTAVYAGVPAANTALALAEQLRQEPEATAT